MHRLALAAALCLLAGPAMAQGERYTARQDNEPLLTDPGGTRIGRLAQGARLDAGAPTQGFIPVTLDGWIFGRSVQRANQDGHNLQVVVGADEENIRAAPNGTIIARLVNGAYLDQVARSAGWVHVRRTLFVAGPDQASRQVTAAAPPAGPVDSAQGPDDSAAGGGVDARRGITRRRLLLFRGPGGPAAATLEPGTTVRVTARANGWVRVEAQGWVRESEIRPADNSILSGVSAAELRATPDEFKGKLLRWTIQYIALQTADELRPDFEAGQKYILARGPAPEYAFVYIAIPDAKLADIQKLAPLSSVEIVARVLNGRSQYLSNPILELVDITQ